MKNLLLLVFLLGCTDVKNGQEISPKDSKDDFGVTKLFSINDCVVYRFYDAEHYRYFTTCDGSVSQEHSEQCGKATCSRPDALSTIRRRK